MKDVPPEYVEFEACYDFIFRQRAAPKQKSPLYDWYGSGIRSFFLRKDLVINELDFISLFIVTQKLYRKNLDIKSSN